MNKKKILTLLLIIIPILLNTAKAQQTTTVTDVTIDAWVNEQNVNTNYGTTSYLNVREHSTFAHRTYIQFNITNKISGCFTVSGGELCLYLGTDGTTNNISLYHVYDNTLGGQTETTIT